MTHVRYWLALSLLALCAAACAQPIKTSVELVGGTPEVGKNFTLAVKIDEDTPVERLYGMCFNMQIDVTKMVSTTPFLSSASIANSFLPGPRSKAFSMRNGHNYDLVFCVTREGPITGVDGVGEIGRFTFTGVGAGTANISFTDNYLVLDDESHKPVEMESASVTIAPGS